MMATLIMRIVDWLSVPLGPCGPPHHEGVPARMMDGATRRADGEAVVQEASWSVVRGAQNKARIW
jgi:hypothetical protein